jgi:hypothetical protein
MPQLARGEFAAFIAVGLHADVPVMLSVDLVMQTIKTDRPLKITVAMNNSLLQIAQSPTRDPAVEAMRATASTRHCASPRDEPRPCDSRHQHQLLGMMV